jgi:hypothetical protein
MAALARRGAVRGDGRSFGTLRVRPETRAGRGGPLSYTGDYKELVTKHGMSLTPSIVVALDKLDANKDVGKRKALFDGAVAAITKWDTENTAQLKAVSDQKEKLGRSQLAFDMRKMKQSLQAASSAPPPPPPASPEPAFKKTNLSPEYFKARSEVPFGAVGVALWNLDRAETQADGKQRAAAAHSAIEKELVEVDASVKGATDTDLKLKVSQYGVALRKLLATVATLKK